MKKVKNILIVLILLTGCFVLCLTNFSIRNNTGEKVDEIVINYRLINKDYHRFYFNSNHVKTDEIVDTSVPGKYYVKFYKDYFPIYKKEVMVTVKPPGEPEIMLRKNDFVFDGNFDSVFEVSGSNGIITNIKEVNSDDYQTISEEVHQSFYWIQRLEYRFENNKIVDDTNNKNIKKKIHYGIENCIYVHEEETDENKSKIYILAVGPLFEHCEEIFILDRTN